MKRWRPQTITDAIFRGTAASYAIHHSLPVHPGRGRGRRFLGVGRSREADPFRFAFEGRSNFERSPLGPYIASVIIAIGVINE